MVTAILILALVFMVAVGGFLVYGLATGCPMAFVSVFFCGSLEMVGKAIALLFEAIVDAND